MAEKEYIVSLNRGVDYDAFNSEMIASTGAGDIPDRTVDVADARAMSTRNTHYALTDAEAESLRKDKIWLRLENYENAGKLSLDERV